MAKESGIGLSITIDDAAGAPQDLSNDITQCSWTTPTAVQDTTGLDKEAMERLLLRHDGTLDLTYVFNDAADMAHVVFKTASSTKVVRTVTLVISGQTLAMEMVITSTAYALGSDGSLVGTVSMALSDGTAPTWS